MTIRTLFGTLLILLSAQNVPAQTVTNSTNVTWSGTNGSTWQNNYANWQTPDGLFHNGDSIIFNDTATGTRTVAIDTAGVTAADILVNTIGTYIFTGGAITTSALGTATTLTTATGALTKLGSGTLDFTGLTGSNNFQGSVYLTTGVLRISSAAQLGVPLSKLTFNGTASASGTLQVAAGSNLVFNGAVGAPQLLTGYYGAISLDAGSTFTITGGYSGFTQYGGAFTLAAKDDAAFYFTNASTLSGRAMSISGLFTGNNIVFSNNQMGAIDCFSGTLILSHVQFNNNSGGAITITNYSPSVAMQISNALFASNTGGAQGGAIYNYAASTITSSTFMNNWASDGGAIFNQASNVLTLTDVSFLNNTSSGGISKNSGGAIFNNGGIININVTSGARSVFSGNGNGNGAYCSIYGWIGTGNPTTNINIAQGGVLDMLDPISGEAGNDTIITSTGAGLWKLGGTTSIQILGYPLRGQSTLLVASGTLHLYRQGELGTDGVTAATTGAISFTSSATNIFSLGRDSTPATLGLGGGNSITVGSGTIAFNRNSIITFSSPAAGDTLTLTGTTIFNGVQWNMRTADSGTSDNFAITGTVTFLGSNTLNIASWTSGTYTLLTSNNLLAANAANSFTILSNGYILSPARQNAELSLDSTNRNLLLSLSPILNLANLAWSGTNTGLWASNYANWQIDDGQFLNGDSVTFNDTLAATGTRVVQVDTAGVTAADILVSTTGAYIFTGGAITTSTANSTIAASTAGKLTIDGPGIAILDNTANNFTGGIAINSGTLQGNTQTLAVGAAASIANNSALVFDQASSGTFASAVIGSGSLTKRNTGTLTLASSANTYTGATRIVEGTLIAGANNALGATTLLDIAANATFDLAKHTQTIGTLTTASTSTLNLNSGTLAIQSGGTINGTLAGTAGSILNITGGALTINSANPTFAATTNIAAGAAVTLTNATALGNTATANVDGNLTLATQSSAPQSQSFDLSLTGTGALNLNASTLTLTGNNTIASINITNGSNITAASASALGTAATRIAINNATLTLAQNNTTLGAVTMNDASRLAFDIATPSTGTATLAGLASTGNVATLAFNTNIGAHTADLLIVNGAITGTYNIAIANTGDAPAATTTTLVLVKANGTNTATYNGSGTLTFNNAPTLYAYNVTPADGATLTMQSTRTLAPAGAAIIANATLPQTWFAELDTIEKRLGDLHLDTRKKTGADLWLRAYAQRLNVNDTDTLVPFNENQYGMDSGLDYGGQHPDYTTYIGSFIGYGRFNRTVQNMNASGNTTSINAGVYFTCMTAGGWYLDAVAKYNHFKNDLTATAGNGPMNGSYTNNAYGASFEFANASTCQTAGT